MSWNGSGLEGAKPATNNTKSNRVSTRFIWSVVGILAVGAIAFVAIFALPKTDSKEAVKEPATKTTIKEVKPAKSAKPRVEKPEPLTNKQIRMLPESETNQLSAVEIEYWKMFHPYPPPDKDQPTPHKGAYAIFDEHVDNEIAAVLATEPGTMIIGNRTYGEAFERRFRNSIKKPIIVKEDDSEYDKALKRSVIQAKIEMKAALDNGEDIGQMMLDARDELVKLGRYRAELEKTAIREIRKASSDDDVEIVIQAVNQMLESRGIAPIEGNALTRLGIIMQESTSKENYE